jgi:integrase
VLKRLAELRGGAATTAQQKRAVKASRTVNDYWDKVFRPECERDPRQEKFLQHKTGRWEKYYRNDPIGSVKLVELSRDDIRAFWDRLTQHPDAKAQATRIQIFGILGQILAYASDEDDYPGKNPFPAVMKKIEKVGDSNRREAWFKPQTALNILEAILNPPNGRCELRTGDERELFECVLTTLWTGLRANELMQLKKQHFDADTDAIVLLVRRRSKNIMTHYIRLPKQVADMLRRRVADKTPDDLMFPSFWNGKNPSVKSAVTALGQRFGYVLDRLKINEGITDSALVASWHTTRHTAITWKMIETNGDVPTTRAFARHRVTDMTMRYTHYLEQDLTSVREGLASFWERLECILNPRPLKIVSNA